MIKYIGKKHLNSNLYRRISLKRVNDYIEVKTLVDERFKNVPTIKVDNLNILQQIDGLDDYGKIKEIVMYFLRNNVICELIQTKDRIVVISTSSRVLELQLSHEYQSLMNDIINKYNNDRLRFLTNCPLKKICIQLRKYNEKYRDDKSTSNYSISKDVVGKKQILLTLLEKRGKLAPFEKKFMVDYIKSLINESVEMIDYYSNVYRTHLYINEKIIDMPIELIKEFGITTAMLNRNFELSEMNDKQYKLEGIK